MKRSETQTRAGGGAVSELDSSEAVRSTQAVPDVVPQWVIDESHPRIPLRFKIEHPGGGVTVHEGTGRILTAGHVVIQHRGYVHRGSRCLVELKERSDSKPRIAAGRVGACKHVQGDVHETVVAWGVPIDPLRFTLVRFAADGSVMEDDGWGDVKGKVLVCDSEGVCRLIGYALAETTVELASVHSGQSLSDAVREVDYDVVLTDLSAAGEDMVRRLQQDGYLGSIVMLVSGDGSAKMPTGVMVRKTLKKPHDLHTIKPLLRGMLTENASAVAGGILSNLKKDARTGELLEWYLKEVKQHLALLDASLDAGDRESTLRGLKFFFETGMAYGYPLVSDAAERALEVAAKDPAAPIPTECLRGLRSICRRLR